MLSKCFTVATTFWHFYSTLGISDFSVLHNKIKVVTRRAQRAPCQLDWALVESDSQASVVNAIISSSNDKPSDPVERMLSLAVDAALPTRFCRIRWNFHPPWPSAPHADKPSTWESYPITFRETCSTYNSQIKAHLMVILYDHYYWCLSGHFCIICGQFLHGLVVWSVKRSSFHFCLRKKRPNALKMSWKQHFLHCIRSYIYSEFTSAYNC